MTFEPEARLPPRPPPLRPGAPGPPTLSTPMLLATCVAAAVGVAALVELKRPAGDPFAALDARYVAWREPPPPLACRQGTDATTLAGIATDLEALRALAHPSAEASYLLARASSAQGRADAALERATDCPGFAAAEHLAGQRAVAAGDLAAARPHLDRAVAAAPRFAEARATRGGVLVAQGALEEALAEGNALITADSGFAGGFLVRALALTALQARASDGGTPNAAPPSEARKDLCTAARLGSAPARALLGDVSCP